VKPTKGETTGDVVRSLIEAFGEIPDHRRAQGRQYPLANFLALVTAALFAGRRGLRSIRRWALELTKPELGMLGLRRVPSIGAFSTILRDVNAPRCEETLSRWAASAAGGRALGSLAIDGKTLRGSASGDEPAVHLVSVFATGIGSVLAQMPIERTNEAKKAVELLDRIDLRGELVTGDAAFTQREICTKVLQRKGDYLLAVKGNQPTLRSDCVAAFEPPSSPLPPRESIDFESSRTTWRRRSRKGTAGSSGDVSRSQIG